MDSATFYKGVSETNNLNNLLYHDEIIFAFKMLYFFVLSCRTVLVQYSCTWFKDMYILQNNINKKKQASKR